MSRSQIHHGINISIQFTVTPELTSGTQEHHHHTTTTRTVVSQSSFETTSPQNSLPMLKSGKMQKKSPQTYLISLVSWVWCMVGLQTICRPWLSRSTTWSKIEIGTLPETIRNNSPSKHSSRTMGSIPWFHSPFLPLSVSPNINNSAQMNSPA